MLTFFIDTNRINARQNLNYMNELEQLSAEGKCSLSMPYHAWKEAETGSNLLRQSKVCEYDFIQPLKNESQRYWYNVIEAIVFPSRARTENEKNDLWILVTAREMNYPIITNDGGSKKQSGGMLGNAQELKKIGVTVVRDLEAVAWVNRA
jgi:hypothetical protein